MSGGVGSQLTLTALDRALAAVNEANRLVAAAVQGQADAAEIARLVASAVEAAQSAASIGATAAALVEQVRSAALQVSRDANAARSAANDLDAARGAAASSAESAAASLATILSGIAAVVGGADTAHDTLGKIAALLTLHANAVNNPHAVTAGQVGAYTRLEADNAVTSALAILRADLKAADIHDATSFGRSILMAASAAASRALLGLGSAATLAAASPGGAATLDPSTGKLLAAQVPDTLLGAVRFQTFWDAAANNPALPAPSADNKGFYYIVTTAGATALAGRSGSITDWQVGDWAVSDGTYWGKVDSSDQVVSVAGLQGVVTAAGLKSALSIAVSDISDATVNGRSLISAANFAAMRTLLGLVVGTNVQAWDADLDAIAALTTTAFGRSLLTAANAAALKATLGVAAADITDASANGRAIIQAADYSAMKTLLGLVIGTNVQAWDADLDAIAALATTVFGRSLLTAADAAGARSALGAQAALGFQPVQQGGGAGQGTNKVYLGYAAAVGPKLQVDASDMGRIWTDAFAPASLATSGYQKFPNGLIIQWIRTNFSSPDNLLAWPITFPNAVLCIVGTVETADTAGASLYAMKFDNVAVNGGNARIRVATNGGGVTSTTGLANVIIIGY